MGGGNESPCSNDGVQFTVRRVIPVRERARFVGKKINKQLDKIATHMRVGILSRLKKEMVALLPSTAKHTETSTSVEETFKGSKGQSRMRTEVFH